MKKERTLLGLFMSFLMIVSVFAMPTGFSNARPNRNTQNRSNNTTSNNMTNVNNTTNMTLNNTTVNKTNITRQIRNRHEKRGIEHKHIPMRHVRDKLMRIRQRVEHLIMNREIIMKIHKSIKTELMPLMYKTRLQKKKALELKKELMKECGTNVSNYTKCNVTLVDEYVNTTKIYLINALNELKIKLEIMNIISNDTSSNELITNITNLTKEVETAKNLSDLEKLKPELEEVVHETRLRLMEDGVLTKFAVLSLFVDKSLTTVKSLELRINNTTVDNNLQNIENSLLEIQTKIANITSSNLTTNYKNLSKEFITLKTEYIETMKNLKKILIEYMKARKTLH